MARTQAKDERKRKRKYLEEESKKRPKVDDEINDGDEDDAQARILVLESEVLESKKNFNNITTLIGLANDFKEENIETATLASVALCRIFVRLLASGSVTYNRALSEKEVVRVEWLKARLADFKSILTSFLLRDGDLASTALTLAMKVLQAEGEYLQEKDFYVFPKAFLEQIVRALIKTENTDAPSEFVQKFLDEYDDVRFFTHQAIK
jgi:U3 small nucleolar RNA-associated protein 19